MSKDYVYRQDFGDDTEIPASDSEFEECTFTGCRWPRAMLDGCSFENCRFVNCDLSMVSWDSARLDKVVFQGCKLVGGNFGKTSRMGFAADFLECLLDYAVYNDMDLRHSKFQQCSLREATFQNCNLSGLNLIECELDRAVWTGNDLTSCDFRSARHYSFHPDRNKIKKARFAYPGLLGLLSNWDIRIDDE